MSIIFAFASSSRRVKFFLFLCLWYEIHNKPQSRLLKKNELKPPDYDMFAQCYFYVNVLLIYEAVQEPEIKDSEETIDNPFENESVFMSNKKRKYKDRRSKDYFDDDPDIATEQNRHDSDNVHIIQ